MIYNNEINSEVILDESVQSTAIAKGINIEINNIKKELEKNTDNKLSSESNRKVFTKIKFILSTLLNFVGKGLSGASAGDTVARTINKKRLTKELGTPVNMKGRLIRNAIQFIVGIILSTISMGIDESIAEDTVKNCHSIISDLKKIKEKTDDDSLVKFIDNKIEILEEKLKRYGEAKP